MTDRAPRSSFALQHVPGDSPFYVFALFSQCQVSAFVLHIADLDVTLWNQMVASGRNIAILSTAGF